MKRNIKYLVIFIVCVLTFSLSGCSPLLRGKSAYEIAVDNGYRGTVEEWLESLKGDTGASGLDGHDGQNFNKGFSVYDLYEQVVNYGGYEGTFQEFVKDYFAPQLAEETQIINDVIFSVCSIVSKFEGLSGSVAGSGVFYWVDTLNGDAIILTNYHVIFNEKAISQDKALASHIQVYIYGSESVGSPMSFEAKFEGGSATYDLALLSVKGSQVIKKAPVKAANLQAFEQVYLGERVYAVGNAGGYGLAASKGILSVVSENITVKSVYGNQIPMRVIRYDADVSNGNSGGGLFNSKGELIGIVNAKSNRAGVEGVNYAIPSNVVRAVTRRIMADCVGTDRTTIKKPIMGVNIEEQNSIAQYDSTSGTVVIKAQVYVTQVSDNSIAKEIFKVGDRILKLEYSGKTYEINRSHILADITLCVLPDEQLTYTILRDGKEMQKTLTFCKDCFADIR